MSSLIDGHRYFLDVDPEGMSLRVECPWNASPRVVDRPCWPTDLDGKPEEPPQELCTFEQWADALDWTEIIHGSFTAELGCKPEWISDSLELHLVRVARAWCTTPIVEPVNIPGAPETIRSITHGPMSPLKPH